MANEHDDDDYKVGPGRPPRQYRFVKGKSGNERGRPAGSYNRKTLRKMFIEVLIDGTVTVNERGGPRTMNRSTAMLNIWAQKGLQGDLRAIEKIFDWLDRLARDETSDKTSADHAEDDEAILRRFGKLPGMQDPGSAEDASDTDEPDEDDEGCDDD